MKDIMLDIETLGTDPGDVVLSIAAVQFDLETGETGKEFYVAISLEDSIKLGFKISPSTLRWWQKQNKEARDKSLEGVLPVQYCLSKFSEFVESVGEGSPVKVWGNSNRFDCGLVAALYNKLNLPLPWKHWNERDVRTLVSFAPGIKANMVFEGTQHDPLDDCKHQIKYCSSTYNSVANLNLEI